MAAALLGCGGGSSPPERGPARARAVERYLAQVEPIRHTVNRLLDRADPILREYALHRIGAETAERRMRVLERRFAARAAAVAGLAPVPRELAPAQRRYAHTYLLEDAYLRALAAAIPSRRFDHLPRTAAHQRAAILAWRARLEAVADRLWVPLPADIGSAGRGEIAPSPRG